MYYYRIAEITIRSCYVLKSFFDFLCEAAEPDTVLEATDEEPPKGTDQYSGTIAHRKTDDGWFFHYGEQVQQGLFIRSDYSILKIYGLKEHEVGGILEWFVRIALECLLVRKGYVSLHSAALEDEGSAYAFSGPSGVGKSTRVDAWVKGLDAKLINGDRPLIDVRNLELFGVPWDGKEQCFRNVHYPLKAICEIRRSKSVYVRKLSFPQRRKLLLRQCFMPMWDTETATIQMGNIVRLAAAASIVRVFSGPTTEDVRALKSALNKHQYLEEEADMKAKQGFVLRNVVDEYLLMPTGDNIGKFNGTVLLNEVSAFVWEKLQTPLSKEDLLKAILDEFEVEKAVASKDLDALLDLFRSYDVIEDE